jgi:urease accessory protein
MQVFNKCLVKGQGLAPALVRRASTIALDWDVRQKSRFDATTNDGQHVGVFLPRGQVLRGGDVLVSTAGGLLCVVAAPQAVLRISPCPTHGSPFDLVRAAYHLGNRHVPIELTPTHLHIEPDHVLADMLRAMHLIVTACDSPFEPESGAYGDHGAHSHRHPHGPADTHDHAGAHAHPSDPACAHSHGHSH